MEKVVTGKRDTLTAESTLASVYLREKVDRFARVKCWLSNDNSACTCSDRFTLTEFTWLGEPKCLYGQKLARLGG